MNTGSIHPFSNSYFIFFDTLRTWCVLMAFTTIIFQVKIWSATVLYARAIRNKSTLWVSGAMFFAMIFIMFTELGQLGRFVDWWRIWVGTVGTSVSVCAAYKRSKELDEFSKSSREKTTNEQELEEIRVIVDENAKKPLK